MQLRDVFIILFIAPSQLGELSVKETVLLLFLITAFIILIINIEYETVILNVNNKYNPICQIKQLIN